MEPFIIDNITIYSEDNQSVANYLKKFEEYLITNSQGVNEIKIYISSSIELNFLDEIIIYRSLNKLLISNINYKVSIISLGCVSLYGALSDFSQTSFRKAIVLMIEAPIRGLQHMLNCLGIGNQPGQDGLVSKTGIGFLCLEKSPKNVRDTCLWINSVEILASKKERFSTISMIENFAKTISFLKDQEDINMVSFKIQTRWCDNLIHGLDIYTKNMPFLDKSNWLDSIEQNNIHYHGMKPIYELIKYRDTVKRKPLIIPCLGAGGRIGILKISDQPEWKKVSTTALSKVIHISSLSTLHKQAKLNKLTKENITKFFYFMQTKYREIDNLYFEWVI